MKSKIRVEYDFTEKEPYIQMYLEKDLDDQPDMRDQMLKSFIEGNRPIWICHPPHNVNNTIPQIRYMDNYTALVTMRQFCHDLFNQKPENEEIHSEIENMFKSIFNKVF